MIFAVRDRLRAEERHLGAHSRSDCCCRAATCSTTASQMLASTRQLLGAYDPTRRLAQGWSIVTERATARW